jgi:hypothetical protein
MNAPIQNSPTLSNTLNARKAHLGSLLKTIDVRLGKPTVLQSLTIGAIKAEIVLIEQQIKKRK